MSIDIQELSAQVEDTAQEAQRKARVATVKPDPQQMQTMMRQANRRAEWRADRLRP